MNFTTVLVAIGTLLCFLDLVLSFTAVPVNRVLLTSLGATLIGVGFLIGMGGIH